MFALQYLTKMWPMFVDYSDDECRRQLRSLELEAYAAIVNALRAQGSLTRERKKILQDLCCVLSIPVERHKAEVRRAVNDEHLNTIAERLAGPNTSTGWAMEGRRVVPLMHRLAPHTIFTEIANLAANAQAAKNATLPPPGRTGVRTMNNGAETMARRKRRDYNADSADSPQKVAAMDSPYFHSVLPPAILEEHAKESLQVHEAPSNSENIVPEHSSQPSFGYPDLSMSRTLSSLMSTSSSATSKPSPKQLLKTSTIATYSNVEQISPSLAAGRRSSQSAKAVFSLEDPTPTSSESPDLKNIQRQLQSVSSVKPAAIVIPTAVSSSTTLTAKERLPTSTAPSQGSKFLHQLRTKVPSHARQNLPTGLGIKLPPQTQVSQRAVVPLSKSPGMKAKHETTPSIFTKKSSTTFSSLSDKQMPQYPVSLPSSETLTITKSSPTVTKTKFETKSPTASNQPLASKPSPSPKSVPKATAPAVTASHNSGLISRSIFSAANKSTKSLPPVIFNVASTSCAALQTTTKTTSPGTSEAGKTSPKLIPKSTTVGISSSQLKLNTSTTQTIQYRNDGGLVRSARIVNLTQPVGSRLPCAISPSAISALGLSNALSPTALRVTLPAGTLNTSSALRVSAAAKPNVIVVHKAQMWPRAQQGAAVIMSPAPLPKMPTDVQETIITTKDKKSPTGTKTIPRAIAPARPQSPAVSVTSVRISESSLVQSPSSQRDSTMEIQSSNMQEKRTEVQCKRNLLVDIMEESGLVDNSGKVDIKDKGSEKDKDLSTSSNKQESEVSLAEKGTMSATKTSQPLPESNVNVCKSVSDKFVGSAALLQDKNGKEVTKPTSLEVQPKDEKSVIPLVNTGKESATTSAEGIQKEVKKQNE